MLVNSKENANATKVQGKEGGGWIIILKSKKTGFRKIY